MEGQYCCASGAGAKVEKNVEKNENHEAWKARPCGLVQLKTLKVAALCSASTGTENFLVTLRVLNMNRRQEGISGKKSGVR